MLSLRERIIFFYPSLLSKHLILTYTSEKNKNKVLYEIIKFLNPDFI